MWLVCGKVRTEATTTKEEETKKKKQEEENKIKRSLTGENQVWSDWKFQIDWNKLECMNPRSRDEIKNPFCVSSKTICFKDNKKSAHWVGHSKLRSLDLDELFKRTPNFDEKEASVTGKTLEEKNTVKKTTDDADENIGDNEIIHKYKEEVVTIEE